MKHIKIVSFKMFHFYIGGLILCHEIVLFEIVSFPSGIIFELFYAFLIYGAFTKIEFGLKL